MTNIFRNVFLYLILLIQSTTSATACSCEGEGSVPASLSEADVAFSGLVISKTITTNYDSLGVVLIPDTGNLLYDFHKYPSFVVKIKVDKMYKGTLISDTLTILTPASSGSCGYYFQTGQNYIVYATNSDYILEMFTGLKRYATDNITFWTHMCTRTQKWNSLEENELLEKTK